MPKATSASRPERGKVKARGFARHFEGWQPGLLAIFLAGSSAIVAVPRPVAPVDVPEPAISPRALELVRQADERLAAEAERNPPELDVRALGQAIRDYGRTDATSGDAALMTERKRVAEAARLAAPAGVPALLRLRAYQLRAFLAELRAWQKTGEETPELRELSGRFLGTARENGWIVGRRVLLDRAVLATLFKKRWNDLAMFHGEGFDPSLDELRAFYRFILLHPPPDGTPGRDGTTDVRSYLSAQQYRLRKVDDLARIDAAYPGDLARGVLQFRLHRYALAAQSFQRWLEQHPEGPYTLRAQNYLGAALENSLGDAPQLAPRR